MPSLLPNGRQQFIDANGAPLVGGMVYFYAPGTANPVNTYKDQAGSTPNTNPVVLDSNGQATIWGNGTYRQVVQNASGVQIWDQVISSPAGSGDLSAATGAALIGYGTDTLGTLLFGKINRVVDSIASLRTVPKLLYTRVFVTGYYAAGDGGGGEYYYDPSDTSSADNGGTIIVAGDGARWKLRHGNSVTADQFGADATGATNAATRLQALIDWCQSNDVEPHLRENGSYLVNSTVTLKHGRSASDPRVYLPLLFGNDSTLIPAANVLALAVVPRCLLTDAATGRGVAKTHIERLYIAGYLGPTTSRAFIIGLPGYACDSFSWSYINITVQSFTGGFVVQANECRHILWDRLCIRGGTFLVSAVTAGSLSGDHVFIQIELNGNVANPPLTATSSSSGAQSQVRGLHFIQGAIYGTGTNFSANNNNQIGDVWFEGTQIDAPGANPGEVGMSIYGSGTAQLFQFHLDNMYIAGVQGCNVYVQTDGAASIYGFQMNGGEIGGTTLQAAFPHASVISLINVEQASVNNVLFDSVTPGTSTNGSLVSISGSTNVTANGNQATRCSAVPTGIAIGGASNNYTVALNMLNVVTAVSDTVSGSPVRTVGLNLAAL